MSDHTPGPWTWHTSCSWRRLMRDDRGQSSSVLMPVRSPTDGHPNIVVTPEDMVLIAAAPDLLEASEIALATAEAWIRGELDGTPTLEAALEKLDPVRAAIAKARGERVAA